MKLFKKLSALAVCSAMVMTCAPNAFAAEMTTAGLQLNGTTLESPDVLLDYDTTYIEAEYFSTITNKEIATDSAKTINNKAYLPLRETASALGYEIGWDNDEQTVILLNYDELLGNPETDYTLMDKYIKYSKAFTEKYPYLSGKLLFDVTVDDGTENLAVSGICDMIALTTMEEMTVNTDFKLDLGEVKAYILEQYGAGGFEEDPGLSEMLNAIENFNMDFYMDVTEGKFYVTSDLFPYIFGSAEGTWFLLDFNEFMSAFGGTSFDFSALSKLTKAENFASYAESFKGFMPALTDVEAAEATAFSLTMIKDLFSDEAFVKDGNKYTSTYTLNEAGTEMTMDFTLRDNGNSIYGFDISMVMAAAGLMEMGMDASLVNTDLEFDMYMNVMEMMKADFDGSFKYSSTTDRGFNAPTEDSNVFSFMELMM